MKSLIMLLSVVVMLAACGTKNEKPTANDAKKESTSMIDAVKKKADKAAADTKKEADKAAADTKKEAGDALKKIGG